MAIIIGNEKEFENQIQGEAVLVDFYATWCGPCKMLSPVLEELAEERSNIKIIKIDVDQNESLAKQYRVMSVPTLFLFKDGKQVAMNSGFLPKPQIEEWIKNNL